MADEAEIRALRAEVAGLTAELALLRATVQSRGAGENDPISINHKLRRLEEETGSSGTSSSTPAPPADGSLGAGWATLTIAQRVEVLRAVVCAIKDATIHCNEDGTITLEIDLPEGICT